LVLHVTGRDLTQRVVVKQDPRMHWSAQQLRARYTMIHELFGDMNQVDTALNTLSTVLNEAPIRTAALAGGNGALALRIAGPQRKPSCC